MLRTRKGLDPTPHLLRPLFPEPTPIGTPFTRPTQFEPRSIVAFKKSLDRAVAELEPGELEPGYVNRHPDALETAVLDYLAGITDKRHSDEPDVKPPPYLAFQLPAIGDGVLYQPYDSLSDTDEEPVTDPHNFQLHKYNKITGSLRTDRTTPVTTPTPTSGTAPCTTT